MDWLQCPDCKQVLDLNVFDSADEEISEGLVYCSEGHIFPIVGGIPRMLPSSFQDHWPQIRPDSLMHFPERVRAIIEEKALTHEKRPYDTRTKANFSNQWDHHEIGGRTWTMDLRDRVRWFFLDSIGIPEEKLNGKTMLDAGCGNGSQSVAYTEFGLEVVAVDLSTGLEKGYVFRKNWPGAKPEKIHFVQCDLQNPPLAPDSFDIIHSVGVLHHTPNTEHTFRKFRPLLKAGGTFYVWLYKYEAKVTPLVNSIRAVTTRVPAPVFALIAQVMSTPFIGFCWAVDKLGIRQYQTPNRKEATLAIHDIFGAPYAHYHSFEEVSDWYKSVDITEIWPCNDGRRGFGVCGRIANEETKKFNTAERVGS